MGRDNANNLDESWDDYRRRRGLQRHGAVKRGSNIHSGTAIQVTLSTRDRYLMHLMRDITERPLVDVMLHALRHREFYPHLYEDLKAKTGDRVHLRVSKALALDWADQSWAARLPRSEWLGAILSRFFTVTDLSRTAEALFRCEDVAYLLENSDE